jgi:hypothetical protein
MLRQNFVCYESILTGESRATCCETVYQDSQVSAQRTGANLGHRATFSFRDRANDSPLY